MATLLIFYYEVSVRKLLINVEGERNVFCQEVDVVKDKDLEDVTLEQPDVLSIIQGLRKLVKTDSVCICFVTKHHYSALLWFECWFSFSLFLYIFKVEVVI